MELIKTELYRYQRRVLRKALRKKNFGLFLDMRTGKTLITLAILAKLWQRERNHLILVICPKCVVGVWKRQIKEHVNISYKIRTNPKAIISRLWRSRIKSSSSDTLHFLIINYEQSWRLEKYLKKLKWHTVICDEGHRIKKHSAKQSKSAHRIAKTANHRYELTGTPVVQGETDLFAQFRFIDDRILGSSWTDFTERFCRKSGYMGYKWKLRPGLKRKKFYELIKPHQFKLLLSEAMPELPQTQDLILEFELTGHAARSYEEMEANYYLEFGGYEFANDLAVVNMLRLQELAGGFLDNGEQIIELEQNKLQIMTDWLSDFPKNKKVVIFARFTEEIDAIAKTMKRLGRSYCILDGRTKNKDVWMDFQYKKSPTTFISQISSGSLGIELSTADTVIFFSRTFSFTDYSQARARLLGPNQKNCVQYIHLIGKKTVDVDVDVSLNKKHETSNDVHRQLKRRRYKMAKKKAKEKKKPTPPPLEKPDYGVAELAEELDTTPTLVRQKLRAAGIKKSGRTYDFKTKKGVKEVAAQLKKAPEKKKKTKKTDDEDKPKKKKGKKGKKG